MRDFSEYFISFVVLSFFENYRNMNFRPKKAMITARLVVKGHLLLQMKILVAGIVTQMELILNWFEGIIRLNGYKLVTFLIKIMIGGIPQRCMIAAVLLEISFLVDFLQNMILLTSYGGFQGLIRSVVNNRKIPKT